MSDGPRWQVIVARFAFAWTFREAMLGLVRRAAVEPERYMMAFPAIALALAVVGAPSFAAWVLKGAGPYRWIGGPVGVVRPPPTPEQRRRMQARLEEGLRAAREASEAHQPA